MLTETMVLAAFEQTTVKTRVDTIEDLLQDQNGEWVSGLYEIIEGVYHSTDNFPWRSMALSHDGLNRIGLFYQLGELEWKAYEFYALQHDERPPRFKTVSAFCRWFNGLETLLLAKIIAAEGVAAGRLHELMLGSMSQP